MMELLFNIPGLDTYIHGTIEKIFEDCAMDEAGCKTPYKECNDVYGKYFLSYDRLGPEKSQSTIKLMEKMKDPNKHVSMTFGKTVSSSGECRLHQTKTLDSYICEKLGGPCCARPTFEEEARKIVACLLSRDNKGGFYTSVPPNSPGTSKNQIRFSDGTIKSSTSPNYYSSGVSPPKGSRCDIPTTVPGPGSIRKRSHDSIRNNSTDGAPSDGPLSKQMKSNVCVSQDRTNCKACIACNTWDRNTPNTTTSSNTNLKCNGKAVYDHSQLKLASKSNPSSDLTKSPPSIFAGQPPYPSSSRGGHNSNVTQFCLEPREIPSNLNRYQYPSGPILYSSKGVAGQQPSVSNQCVNSMKVITNGVQVSRPVQIKNERPSQNQTNIFPAVTVSGSSSDILTYSRCPPNYHGNRQPNNANYNELGHEGRHPSWTSPPTHYHPQQYARRSYPTLPPQPQQTPKPQKQKQHQQQPPPLHHPHQPTKSSPECKQQIRSEKEPLLTPEPSRPAGISLFQSASDLLSNIIEGECMEDKAKIKEEIDTHATSPQPQPAGIKSSWTSTSSQLPPPAHSHSPFTDSPISEHRASPELNALWNSHSSNNSSPISSLSPDDNWKSVIENEIFQIDAKLIDEYDGEQPQDLSMSSKRRDFGEGKNKKDFMVKKMEIDTDMSSHGLVCDYDSNEMPLALLVKAKPRSLE